MKSAVYFFTLSIYMTKTKTDSWIKAGYEVFGKDGIEGLKVERLARILELNKSGFYQYFGSMTTYMQSLLRYHIEMATQVANEVGGCVNLDPDLLTLMVKHKTFFLVESQLLVKCRPSQFGSEIYEAGKIINQKMLPMWKTATQLPEDLTAALAYLNIILHFFYARINTDNMSYELLHALAYETKGVLNKVIDAQHITTEKTRGRIVPD